MKNRWMRTILLSLAGFFALESSVALGEVYEVENVVSLQRRDDGKFDAVCTDGRSDIVTAEQIRANDVCHIIRVREGIYKVSEGGAQNGTVFCSLSIKPEYEGDVLTKVSAAFTGMCHEEPIALTCELYHCHDQNSVIELIALENEKFSFYRQEDDRKAIFTFAEPAAPTIAGTWDLGFDWGCRGSQTHTALELNADGTGTVQSYTIKWTLEGNAINILFDTGTTYSGSVESPNDMKGTMKSGSSSGCWSAVRKPMPFAVEVGAIDVAGF